MLVNPELTNWATIIVFRLKKINCVVPISWENKVGSVGRDFFLRHCKSLVGLYFEC